MKNYIYKILQIIISVVLFLFLTGCDSDKRSDQESVQETTQVTAQTVTQEALTGWQTAYKTVIVNTLKECSEKYPDEANHGGYGLYDFDSDNVPELFVKVYGLTTPDDYINVYDTDEEKAVFLDSIEGAHSWVYGTDRENALLLEYFGSGGESAWHLLEFNTDGFDIEYIASYFPYGIADIEPEENPLPGMGYEIKEIEFYSLDDLTGIIPEENENGNKQKDLQSE